MAVNSVQPPVAAESWVVFQGISSPTRLWLTRSGKGSRTTHERALWFARDQTVVLCSFSSRQLQVELEVRMPYPVNNGDLLASTYARPCWHRIVEVTNFSLRDLFDVDLQLYVSASPCILYISPFSNNDLCVSFRKMAACADPLTLRYFSVIPNHIHSQTHVSFTSSFLQTRIELLSAQPQR